MSGPQSKRWQRGWSRRSFIKKSCAIGMTLGFGAFYSGMARAEPPPETTRIRFVGGPAICIAPQYVAEALLKAEGFTEVEYVKFDTTNTPRRTVASGSADVILDAVGDVVITMRFHALRLREAGVMKSMPDKIIANGTDWRFLNELKRELKT